METVRYLVNLETISPLLLSDRPIIGESSMFQSLDYISGSSLRGAIIEEWKKVDDLAEEEVTDLVREIFLNEFIFENFYIEDSLPLPITVETCKQFPGLITDNREKNHGIKDTLFFHYLNSKSYDSSRVSCKHQKESDKSLCGSMLKPFSGYIREITDYFDIQKITKVQSGHVAIHPFTQTNRKGQLFFEDAIDIGQKL